MAYESPYPHRPIPGRPGWFVEAIPLTFGRARLVVTDGFSVDVGY